MSNLMRSAEAKPHRHMDSRVTELSFPQSRKVVLKKFSPPNIKGCSLKLTSRNGESVVTLIRTQFLSSTDRHGFYSFSTWSYPFPPCILEFTFFSARPAVIHQVSHLVSLHTEKSLGYVNSLRNSALISPLQ